MLPRATPSPRRDGPHLLGASRAAAGDAINPDADASTQPASSSGGRRGCRDCRNSRRRAGAEKRQDEWCDPRRRRRVLGSCAVAQRRARVRRPVRDAPAHGRDGRRRPAAVPDGLAELVRRSGARAAGARESADLRLLLLRRRPARPGPAHGGTRRRAAGSRARREELRGRFRRTRPGRPLLAGVHGFAGHRRAAEDPA